MFLFSNFVLDCFLKSWSFKHFFSLDCPFCMPPESLDSLLVLGIVLNAICSVAAVGHAWKILYSGVDVITRQTAPLH